MAGIEGLEPLMVRNPAGIANRVCAAPKALSMLLP